MPETRKKIPDRCTDHPESGAGVSKMSERESGTQHRCAEPGCQQPLG